MNEKYGKNETMRQEAWILNTFAGLENWYPFRETRVGFRQRVKR